jgi:hypothetical protein
MVSDKHIDLRLPLSPNFLRYGLIDHGECLNLARAFRNRNHEFAA